MNYQDPRGLWRIAAGDEDAAQDRLGADVGQQFPSASTSTTTVAVAVAEVLKAALPAESDSVAVVAAVMSNAAAQTEENAASQDEVSDDVNAAEEGSRVVAMVSVGGFICKGSPSQRILASMRFGLIKGAVVGGIAGAGAGGIGAVPGTVVGGVAGAAGGVFSGGAIALGCSIFRGYPAR